MATTSTTDDKAGFTGSLARSFLTQYWPFTAYVLSYVTVGMGLAAAVGYTFDWFHAGLLLVAMWFGLEGLHAIDLAEADIATRLDRKAQMFAGVAGLGLGGIVGIYLASLTTWWFLVFVGVEVFLGLAYNLELFNGLLHDFDTPSGLANFGLSWGAIPFLAGYYVMAGDISFGVLLVALGIFLDAAQLISLFEISKPEPYDDLGIHHNRDVEQDVTAMNEVTHRGNKMAMAAWAFVALGFVVMFAV